MSDPTASPSDSTGAVGPTRYVEMVNLKMAIYSRSHTLIDSSSLLSLTGDPFLTDPQVIWDPTTDRFYFVVLNFDDAFTGASDGVDFEFGFSTDDSPSGPGDWCTYPVSVGYDIPGSSQLLGDQPHLGDSQNFVFWGINVFDMAQSTPPYLGSDAVWINKPGAGTSCPASLNVGMQQGLKNAGGSFAWTPVGVNQTDTDATGYLVADKMSGTGHGDALTLFAVTDNGDGTATIQQNGVGVSVAPYGFAAPARQAGTTARIDTNDVRLTQAVSAIDPSEAGLAIWTQHTVFGGGGAQVRWYELDPSAPAVFRSGVLTNSNLFVYNAAISPDRVVTGGTTAFGNAMAIGFTTSSVYTDSTVWVASKVADAPVSPWVLVTQSPGANLDPTCTPLCRWGDYMGASPDPAADTSRAHGSVWMTSMWNARGASNSDIDWRTVNWSTAWVSNGAACTEIGTAGDDFLTGSPRAGVLCGLAGNDVLLGGGGNDRLNGSAGNDVLVPQAGRDVASGGSGFDYVDYELARSGVTIDLAAHRATGQGTDKLLGIEGAIGSAGADHVLGNARPNGLYALAGPDAVSGFGGNDFLDGGRGKDRLDGGAGRDRCVSGGGADIKVACEA